MTWVFGVISALVAALIAMGALLHRETTKRVRSEERTSAVSKNAESARATAQVLHQIANETEDRLTAVVKKQEQTDADLAKARRDLLEATGMPEKIAGMFSSTFGGDDG